VWMDLDIHPHTGISREAKKSQDIGVV